MKTTDAKIDKAIDKEVSELARTGGLFLPRLEGCTILIAGANGMVCSYLVETLLLLNAKYFTSPVEIICVCRSREKFENRFSEYLDDSSLRLIESDVCDFSDYDGDIDYIVHGASNASPKLFGVKPIETISANVEGTKNLLEIAKRKSLKGFLYISSAEVYGKQEQGAYIVSEDSFGKLDPTKIRSSYAESKRLAECLCSAYLHEHLVPIKIARLFHSYGPGMSLDDGRIFADLVACAVKGGNIDLSSDGKARRCFCYISDVVDALIRIMVLGGNGEVYNVGNPIQEISMKALADIIVELSGKPIKVSLNTAPDPQYLPSSIDRIVPSIQKLEGLGWIPSTEIREGFSKTIRSYN